MDMVKGIRSTVEGNPPDRPRNARRAGLLVAAVMALGLSVTGCGGSSGNASSAPSSGVQGGGSNSTDNSAQQVKYSQCMREHGVPSFPDPVNGRLMLQMRKGSDLDPDNPTFQNAQKECKSVEPPGLQSGSGPNSQQQEQMLKFVACMRKNGVPKFPDPQVGGFMKIDPSMGVDPESPQFKSATETCRKLLPGGVAPGGQ